MKQLLAVAVAICAIAQAPVAGQKKWTVARTPDGQPDLQGIWDYRSATPLERPVRFAGKQTLTEDEAAEYERLALEREDGPATRRCAHRAVGASGVVAGLRQDRRQDEANIAHRRFG